MFDKTRGSQGACCACADERSIIIGPACARSVAGEVSAGGTPTDLGNVRAEVTVPRVALECRRVKSIAGGEAGDR